MAHFTLEKELSTLLTLDTPLTRGPAPRWQRKAAETSTPGLSISYSSGNNSTLNASLNKTSNSRTPCKSPSRNAGEVKKITPCRNKTPNKTPNVGDRFIPNRSAMQFDVAKYILSQSNGVEENLSPNTSRYRAAMSETLNGDLSNFRIMAFQKKAPLAPLGHTNELKVLYSSSKNPCSSRKTARHIPQNPEQILDAPEIMDDYYLNLIDWNSTNCLAVALAGNLYVWNASTSDIKLLLQLPNPDQYVGSVSWVKDTNCIAAGTSNAEVQIWDVEAGKRLRVMKTHTGRVSSLAWNSHILSSGSQSGQIHHHDVRIAEHHVGSFSGHSLEVCGMQWSPDGRYLASGGNDNVLNIWPATITRGQCQPFFVFNDHQAAVKAVSWCPWQSSILATGGGTADRHIRFWNCSMGTCLNTIDTKSQVCGILWSNEYKELISGHGFVNNELIIWKYPQMTKVAELTGHTARVLNLAMSPDGATVVSAGADETLRLWHCFAVDPKKKKTVVKKEKQMTQSSLMRSIR